MNINKLKKYFPYFYVALLIFMASFVMFSLSEDTLEVKVIDEKQETVEEIKPVKVQLIIESLNNKWTYSKRLQNNDTFDDLLEELRDENEIYFEKTEYTYGTEYHDVNYLEIPENYVWKVYAGGENVTYNTNGLFLKDGWVYRLVLEER